MIIIIATAIVGALGGSTYEEKKIYKNINSSVIGDGNVVSFNNVDEFIKDYQKTIQDNEKLNDESNADSIYVISQKTGSSEVRKR